MSKLWLSSPEDLNGFHAICLLEKALALQLPEGEPTTEELLDWFSLGQDCSN